MPIKLLYVFFYSNGEFYYVTDHSSGSALLRNNYGWVGEIGGYQHTGYGYGYNASSTDVVKTENYNTLKFVDDYNFLLGSNDGKIIIRTIK